MFIKTQRFSDTLRRSQYVLCADREVVRLLIVSLSVVIVCPPRDCPFPVLVVVDLCDLLINIKL